MEVPWRNSLELVRTAPPEAAWHLQGIIPQDSVVLFSGREGTMKSWLALDWAHAVAEGNAWIGRETEAGAVLYLDAEMPGPLFHSRLYAVGANQNLNIWRWQDETFPQKLDDKRLLQAARRHKLIIVDTLRRFMEGLDENSSGDMAIITAKLRQLTKWGASVLALHHGKKDGEHGGYRGSTELGAGVDITLDIEKHKEAAGEVRLRLAASKTRYSDDPRISLKIDRRPDRPIFHDITGEALQVKEAVRKEVLVQLSHVIATLHGSLNRNPNQSEIIAEAGCRKLGSRNTILVSLREGMGTYWESTLDGRSRVYRTLDDLSTCSSIQFPGGQLGQDNRTVADNLSTHPEGYRQEQVGQLDGAPWEEVIDLAH